MQDRLLVERLLDEIDGAGLHRLDRQRHVAMAGDDDGGKAAGLRSQLLQQLDAGHVGHAHVGDQAAALDAREAGKKGGRRVVEAHGKARRAQQEGERLPHGLVVIDDMNDPVIRHRKRSPRSPIAR